MVQRYAIIHRELLIPDEKGLVLVPQKLFNIVENATGYYSGPVALPSPDGALLMLSYPAAHLR